MDWKDIETQADADAPMEVFGDFHDGCLREAHLWTDHWVSPELSISCAGNLDNRTRFLIQRQAENPSAIELLFDEVTRLNLVPTPESHDSVIHAATLLVRDRAIYWSPEGGWMPDRPREDECTWICAKRLRWREVNWLGEKLHYGPKS
ncbi:MAG: hypothetical protein COZ06_31955 [Armatimonadetes bacterium CG_4_10_14_3_um_filter_66_18]|nr:hypothetical protein [Armatimonadota bacterium]OIP07514.1 MAG: hypothetical protein AUJ96_07230 [Armatimonadetes bacterium CG2_30_66_41]PIU89369.1 MAG: hypothetical protein COS65_28770 [Armatimonadetes bacterium CG06_land_8_20_14_3_00_66_21]PIX38354.1 MAG: hypothetical protein COZ57_30840 [Armatimonadetes bacterium CG_4_8_14_3_um_filter_66_20]PIY37977.1 MAG: hypothetical protein COZ06_31955 [Armatimonadetes bacterium CG_4_10_14_3_um_filter_66_18]PIZ31528.1 MAG: hypothetical protein COY42_32